MILLIVACQPQTEPPTEEDDIAQNPDGPKNPKDPDDILDHNDQEPTPVNSLIVNDRFNRDLKVSTRPRITEDYGIKTARNFSINCPSLKLNYSCMKNRKRELIILDAGHDDTSASARSEDHTLDRSDPNYGKPRKHINEGQLNFVVSWMAREMLIQCTPGLGVQEREALMSSIHLSRYPGEKKFGTYQSEGPRKTSVGGDITSGVTNRREWVDRLMKKHRVYDSSHPDGLSETIADYSSRAIFVSIHADNLAYVSGSKKFPYNAIDRSKVYVPKDVNLESNESTILFSEEIETYLSKNGLEFLFPKKSDSSTVVSLKEGAEASFDTENIDIDHHSSNLAMLSSSLGNENTIKVLVEGFAMTGKVGDLISRELDLASHKKIAFTRAGKDIGEWKVSDFYIQYAKSVAESIDRYLECN